MESAVIDLNGLTLTPEEEDGVERMVDRLRARFVSLYRTSEGLRAFVIGGAGEEHLGVTVSR